jgi:hypothetical protein
MRWPALFLRPKAGALIEPRVKPWGKQAAPHFFLSPEAGALIQPREKPWVDVSARAFFPSTNGARYDSPG